MGFLWRWNCQLGSSTIFGLSALAVEAYGFTLVRASVRPSHHIWRSAHQILMIFCTKLHLNESKKCSKPIFEKSPRLAVFRHFWPKNQVFELFLQNRTSEFHITCSKARNNCFQSFNGSVVSGKYLVLAVLAHFWSKIHCLWWQIEVFHHFFTNFFQSADVCLTIFVF